MMIFRNALILLSCYAYAINAQAQAQGGKSVAELLQEVDGKNQPSADANTDIDSVIDEVFNTGGGQPSSTSTPNLQPNSGGTGSQASGPDGCVCVAYYLCNNGSINTNGEGIIDIRINDGPCESYLDVCCAPENRVPEPITPTPPPIPKQTGCGFRNAEGVGFRITGDQDNEAQFGEFPWMVAVLREQTIDGSNKLNVYQCGGALIHPQMVLTAAHCVSDKNRNYKIRAGEWDTQKTTEIFPHQDREVQSIKVHPQYYAGALYNDVAVLYLRSPVDIAENVDVVCLPPQNTVVNSASCYATGWGKDEFHKGKYQVILKKIDLPIVPRDSCQNRLRETRLGKYFELHKSFICAGGEQGKDTCKGDGGSPLVCPIPGQQSRYYQLGIVAWGIGCGDNNTPGVYVNIALFRDWIDQQIREFSLDSSTYRY